MNTTGPKERIDKLYDEAFRHYHESLRLSEQRELRAEQGEEAEAFQLSSAAVKEARKAVTAVQLIREVMRWNPEFVDPELLNLDLE